MTAPTHEKPAKGTPPMDYTPGNVRALGWCAEARLNADGKCLSFLRWTDAPALAEFITDFRTDCTITIFPENITD